MPGTADVVAFVIALVMTGALTSATEEPTFYPTHRPTESIYGDGSISLSSTAEQIVMAVLVVALFVGMLFDIQPPEILFLTAVVITMVILRNIYS